MRSRYVPWRPTPIGCTLTFLDFHADAGRLSPRVGSKSTTKGSRPARLLIHAIHLPFDLTSAWLSPATSAVDTERERLAVPAYLSLAPYCILCSHESHLCSNSTLSVTHAELVPWLACPLHSSVSAIVSLCACFLVVAHSSTAISSALPTGGLLRITPQHVRRSFFVSGDSLFYLFLVLSVWTELSSRSCSSSSVRTGASIADQTTVEASNLHCVELIRVKLNSQDVQDPPLSKALKLSYTSKA